MIRDQLILRAVLPAIAAAALLAHGASAMSVRDGGAQVASDEATTLLLPARIDATAHAATIRGIAAAAAERAAQSREVPS